MKRKILILHFLSAVAALAGTPAVYINLATFPQGVFAGSGLVQGTDGNFYGVGIGDYPAPGSIYKVTPQGALTTIYSFCSQPDCTDGSDPQGFVLGTDG